jgi:hypothetical protein
MKQSLLPGAIALCAAAAPAFARSQSSPAIGKCLAYRKRDFNDCIGLAQPPLMAEHRG